ncbi:MAG: serine/threonine-protein kinase RsbT [Bacteroidales bacterium]|jgi:anti-sigma regulatory factor (Ser/Thr protein kinase)|nr:serine/threonine-protein kinase RsbT [Bacteroidales bacterium]MDN5328692.1 serine/threonine-protein kinase RsbT [Bacteroidales bacterium]
MKLRFHVEGGDFSNAGAASSEVKKLLKQINVPSEIVKRIVVALYEAEVNIVAHAYEGDIEVDIQADRIDALLSDRGPGIADIELAMHEGYSTASPKVREMGFGAGMGLPNIRKNTDILNIESTPGKGTNVSFTVFFQTKS